MLAIKMLLENAYNKYQPDKLITLLTDGGSENVNDTVANYILKDSVTIKHLVAQTDIKFSNSTIESVNKVLKHQFLLPKEISSLTKLKIALKEDVQIYNSERPQFALSGNTPDEVFEGKVLDFSDYTKGFITQKLERIQQNQKNVCKVCR